ncbi:alpha/beta hydrolase fold domain-containing protein [Spelaeicoccus albus]|uniref:Acetyl esterase n=1 Tax=Spelaeicoccus albus TaxID=1280376 RepID=A0A7Z0D235_9MICO|nr:alpha/beta hydrolase fold domain-containing protein [Spelaeicoccus albus]NYI67453.1 acetyl esterase [Spelaeicoccus albus]
MASVPAYVRDALTPGMYEVLDHQLARAAERRGVDSAPGGDRSARLAVMRADYRAERSFWNEGGPQMASTYDGHVHAAGVDVPIRIYRPTAAESLPAIAYFHGGGFNVGDLDTHDRIMRVLADKSGAAVVGVDYTLSPEARFPQALHECAGVVAHLAAEGQRYGIEPSRLVVAGDSAGSMLSMGTVLLLRDGPAEAGLRADAAAAAFASIRGMLLYYGGHGLRDSATSRLYGGFWDGMGKRELGDVDAFHFNDAAERSSPYIDHLSADLSRDLPAAFIVGAELDPLADDGRALAAMLARNGREVDFRMVPGVLHSFLHFGRMLDEANEELARGAEFARAHL